MQLRERYLDSWLLLVVSVALQGKIIPGVIMKLISLLTKGVRTEGGILMKWIPAKSVECLMMTDLKSILILSGSHLFA